MPLLPVSSTGFTSVGSLRSSYLLDIVLVHGLQGHPRTTWMDKKTGKYWPSDLLPVSFPKARVLVYGYDSKVSHFFGGPANQNSFLDHSKNLLLDLQGVRKDDPKRPLLFICHSLGGILIKDVLRRCEPGREELQPDVYENILWSTIGLLFLGTPHRGGNYGSLGKVAERVVRYLGFDTNGSILRDLQSNSTAFELINDEFLRLLYARRRGLIAPEDHSATPITVYTFQESAGLAGVQGLTGKVVDDVSSRLGYDYEIVVSLAGNHMDMCRSLNNGGSDYERLKNAIETCFCLPYDLESRFSWRAIRPPRPSQVHKLPFDRDPNFVGREKELSALTKMLSDDFNEFALVGLGGVGKTQIAIEFAYRLMDHDESVEPNLRRQIFWLHAGSISRLEQGLRKAVESVEHLDVTETFLPSFHKWFCDSRSGRWLIIIDNADDEELFFSDVFQSAADETDYLRLYHNKRSTSSKTSQRYRLIDFLPRKPGCGILYTSRNKICMTRLMSRSRSTNLVTVEPMPDHEAVAMVESGLRGHLADEYLSSIRTFTKQLVLVLDNLPLAISQAIAMMRENEDVRDPRAYLELYSEVQDEQGKFLEENFVDWRRDSDLPNSVFLSWKISLEQVKRRSESAGLLLSLFSVLDRQGIPEWLLAFFPKVSRYDRRMSLNLLHSFSFISRPDTTLDAKKWQMHRLVQIATHAWIGRDGLERTLRMALRMLADAFICHLYAITDRDLSLKATLEYYPHAKSVLSLLETISPTDRSPIVRETMYSFTDQIDSSNSSEIRSDIVWAMSFISQADFNTLEGLYSFVRGLSAGSKGWFGYNGIRPLVSAPLYAALVSEQEADDSEYEASTFIEVDSTPLDFRQVDSIRFGY